MILLCSVYHNINARLLTDCYTSQRREKKMSSTVVAKDHQIDCFNNGN
jgi:hypothetical protein